jgi:hypothetical protein
MGNQGTKKGNNMGNMGNDDGIISEADLKAGMDGGGKAKRVKRQKPAQKKKK